MVKGGVIMDVATADQARIAEDAGAVQWRRSSACPRTSAEGGVAHGGSRQDHRDPGGRVDPGHGEGRIGHFAEAQILEALEVDYIDESEVCPRTRESSTKWSSRCRSCARDNLGEALWRISEGRR